MPRPTPIGHEYVGVVEEVGSAVTTVRPGQFVVGGFLTSDVFDLSLPLSEVAEAYAAMDERRAIKVLLRP